MTINDCPACKGPAKIRYKGSGRGFHVWAECENCGLKTREFYDTQKPTENSTGGKFATVVWNSQIYKKT